MVIMSPSLPMAKQDQEKPTPWYVSLAPSIADDDMIYSTVLRLINVVNFYFCGKMKAVLVLFPLFLLGVYRSRFVPYECPTVPLNFTASYFPISSHCK